MDNDDWLFELLLELCDYTYDNDLTDVSYRLEEALDAYLADKGATDQTKAAFRSRRAA